VFRKGSRSSYYQQRIPVDVRKCLAGLRLFLPVGDERVAVTLSRRSTFVKVSLRTSDPSVTKVRQAEVVVVTLEAQRKAFERFPPFYFRVEPKRATQRLGLRRVQIHPANVSTRKGYPRAGRGAEVGSKGAPQTIRPTVTPNSTAAPSAVRRTHRGNVFGALIIMRPADQRAIPPT